MGIERPYTGLTAEIKIGNVPVGYMSGIDLTLEKSIIEVLQFGATYQEKVPAIKNWTATVDGTLALAPGGSQQKLYFAYENDEEITLGIFLNEFTYFEGKCYVASLNISGAPDDKMSISSELEGNGAIFLNLPTTYNVTANSGVGGTCVPGGVKKVQTGGSYVLQIQPAANYTIQTVIDNDAEVTDDITNNTYTLTNVSEDHIIDIAFSVVGGSNKENLRVALLYADSLGQSAYTTTSWAALATAASTAETVMHNSAATQSQVDSATAALNAAIAGLELAS